MSVPPRAVQLNEANAFLKEHPEVWQAWVSEDAAKKINAAL